MINYLIGVGSSLNYHTGIIVEMEWSWGNWVGDRREESKYRSVGEWWRTQDKAKVESELWDDEAREPLLREVEAIEGRRETRES